MKSWHKIVVVFAVLLAAFLCKNLFAGQGYAEKLSKPVSIEKPVTVGGVDAGNPTTNPEQVSVDKPTKEALIQKTRTLQMPFIVNNGQMDEQVRFYAKTFGGTVFVTKEGEIVYALPEGRGRDVPVGASLEAGMGIKQGGRNRDVLREPPFINALQGDRAMWGHGIKDVFGWHGHSPIDHTDAEYVAANTYAPFLRIDNAGYPPGRVLTNALLVAYLPEFRKETCRSVVSTAMPPLSNVLSDNAVKCLPNNPHSKIPNPQSTLRGVVLKEHLVGGKIDCIAGEQPSVTSVNYFMGNDKSKWKTNVPTYNRVNLGEVYQGIELSLKAHGDNVEKLFCVKPGASPECIKVRLDGSKSLRVNREGQLEVETELGPVKFTRPIAYQEVAGKRVEVAVEYRIHGSGVCGAEDRGAGEQGGNGEPETINTKPTYGFTVASYDKTEYLIIDPLLASTYLGGANWDYGLSLTLDPSGNVYVTGYTVSANFPTTRGANDTSFNGGADVFVSKLDSGLTSLLASTFLGGSGWERGFSFALDHGGNVYVTGDTDSANFPTTTGAYDTSFNGGYEVFISKLNSGLTKLLASTFLGGTDHDYGNSLAIDTSGNLYVTGYTNSTNFPTTSGAYDASFNGGWDDVFVSKLDSGLTSLLASTFLGGTSLDEGHFLTLDASGNVYVTGDTTSRDFPVTSGAYDTSYNGGYFSDAFVSKLDSGLTSLLASTFLGGTGLDEGYFLTLDTSGNVYVTGNTYSPNFPMTSGAYDTSHNGYRDAFLSKLNSGLTSLLASTFLGGSSHDDGYSLALDTSGNVYVTGCTESSNFPTTSGAYDISWNGSNDIFISKLNSELTELLVSTFLGGYKYDSGYSLTLDTSGNIYVTGETWSTDFPTTRGAYDTSFNSGYYGADVFVSKLDDNPSSNECVAESVTASRNKLKLGMMGNADVTITVTGAGCPVEGVSVTVMKYGLRVNVSPGSQKTDANGQAVFTIRAKDKKGLATLLFKTSGLGVTANVQVKVR